ncbi:MAG: hypothetical protein HOF27_00335 [Rhodospirillaceae bacterium]|nr:hypothetical protein [Rhodospirillaceae bacterium]
MARLIGVLLAITMAVAVPAQAQQSTYSQWNNPDPSAGDGKQAQAFIDKLNALVDRAEKARAADPTFLRDLRDLARGFDRPWHERVFDDEFLDGDYAKDPVWTVVSGKYWIERVWGLRSAIDPASNTNTANENTATSNEDKAAQIFGQILNQVLTRKKDGSGDTRSAEPKAAVIHAGAKVSNAFSMEADFSSWSKAGRLQFAVYQGNFRGAASPGYRLGYSPGGKLELLRVSRGGTSVVDRADAPYALEDKKVHRLVWSRHVDGRMTVTIDDKSVIDTTDRGFRDPFSGIALINVGGDYIIKKISMLGAP